MIIEVKVPQLSESVAEATLVSWHKNEGDAVARDENLIDIETDKVVLELPAPDGGVLVKVIKGNGATVVAGEVIAQIDTEAKATAGAHRAGQGRTSCGHRPRPRTRGDAGRAQGHGRKRSAARVGRRQRPWRTRHQGRRAG